MKNNKKVIEFPSSVKWRFFDWVQGGVNPIEEWYETDLSETGRLLFDSLLKMNRKTDLPIHWLGFKRFLQGKLRKERIWELEFRADGRAYRVLGVFGTLRKEAVIIIGCYHKGSVYTPTEALDTAYKRARALSEGRADYRERKIRDDV